MGKYIKGIAGLFFTCFFVSLAFAQTNQTESFTITTYYPSPAGVYRNLKLFPTGTEPSGPALSAGVMYFDNNTNMDILRYRNSTGWINVTGGGGGGGGSSWAVITRTCPWGSSGGMGTADLGWGNQCNATLDDCCTLPKCPAGWTEAGTEVTVSAVTCPKTGSNKGCEYYESDETWYHAVTVGNVRRICVKQGATVLALSTPWASDNATRTATAYYGWGDQCVGPAFTNCNNPQVPTCPSGWTRNNWTDVEVHTVSCPKTVDANYPNPYVGGCYWASTLNSTHPVAGGVVVRSCEKN